MNNSNTRALTIDELDLVSGGKISAGWVGGFWFAHDSATGNTTVGAGGTYVITNPTPAGTVVGVLKL